MRTLRGIKIEGFKSIESAELELGDLNVVIGANGSGKTNLIGVFRLLESVLSRRLHSYVAEEPDRFLFHGREITPELLLEFVFEEFTYRFRLKVVQRKLILDEIRVKLSGNLSINPSGEEQFIYECLDSSESKLEELESRNESIKFVFFQLRNLVVYHFHDTSDSSPARRMADINDNRFFRRDAANLPAYLYWLKQKHSVAFRHIEEHVQLVAPFFECFVLEPFKNNERKINLEWRHKGSDAYFDAWSLSDGTLRFICLATLLLQPSPPALILLDEPELGLHPFAIRILAEMLETASEKSQVILATQSVTLLDNFAPQNVIVAENDGLRTTFKRLDEEKLKVWLEEFSIGELWEKNVLGGQP